MKSSGEGLCRLNAHIIIALKKLTILRIFNYYSLFLERNPAINEGLLYFKIYIIIIIIILLLLLLLHYSYIWPDTCHLIVINDADK